jgi:hypothetical protein
VVLPWSTWATIATFRRSSRVGMPKCSSCPGFGAGTGPAAQVYGPGAFRHESRPGRALPVVVGCRGERDPAGGDGESAHVAVGPARDG